jgi:alpha-ribazole phosphatase
MKKIFLVRHGLTSLNEQRRYCGESNVSLSSQGLKQAQRAADFLCEEKFDSIYTSPLERCLETANAIAKSHDIYPEALTGLSEINFGLWEGLTFEEIQKSYSEQMKVWFENPDDFTFPEGESVRDFRKRVLASLDTVLEEQGNCLIVAHGGSLRIIICHLSGWPMESLHSFELEPAGLTILEHYENSTVVRVLNDTCHLKEGEAI